MAPETERVIKSMKRHTRIVPILLVWSFGLGPPSAVVLIGLVLVPGPSSLPKVVRLKIGRLLT